MMKKYCFLSLLFCSIITLHAENIRVLPPHFAMETPREHVPLYMEAIERGVGKTELSAEGTLETWIRYRDGLFQVKMMFSDIASQGEYALEDMEAGLEEQAAVLIAALIAALGRERAEKIKSLKIGSIFEGGIVFYLDGSGGGLIAATSDQSSNAKWGRYGTSISGADGTFDLLPILYVLLKGRYGTSISGADGTAIGTGKQNTEDIVSQLGAGTYAAKICADYSVAVNGVIYDDWFLPSQDELNEMYKNKDAIGGFTGGVYWSSSEYSSHLAWGQNFDNGYQDDNYEGYSNRVRAVRAF